MANKCIVCGATEVNTSDGICEICALSGQDPYILALNNTTTEQSTQNPIMPSQNFSSEISVKGSGKSRKILLNGGANSANINNNVVSNPSANNTLIYPAGHNFSASVTNTILSAGQIPVNNQQVNYTPVSSVSQTKQFATSGIIKNVKTDVVPDIFLFKLAKSLFSGIPYTLDNDLTTFQVFPDYSGKTVTASGNACDQVIVYGKVAAGVISENNSVEVYGKRDSNNNIISDKIKNIEAE